MLICKKLNSNHHKSTLSANCILMGKDEKLVFPKYSLLIFAFSLKGCFSLRNWYFWMLTFYNTNNFPSKPKHDILLYFNIVRIIINALFDQSNTLIWLHNNLCELFNSIYSLILAGYISVLFWGQKPLVFKRPSSQFPVPVPRFAGSPVRRFPVPSSPSSQFPVPSSQFPVPSFQFPVPSSQITVPRSQFPVPSSQFPDPNSQVYNSQFPDPSS